MTTESTSEAESIAELIDDCSHLPTTLRDPDRPVEVAAVAAPWQVSDGCLAQVRELDEYV